MTTLTARTLRTATLPPVPASPGHPHLLLWHPSEKQLWLLVLGRQQLWRVGADGAGTLVGANEVLGLPPKFPASYLHTQAFYFDTAREAPVWLFSTYADGFGAGLLLGAWNGRTFEPVAQENGIQVASSDSFVFDPARGVLVHFVGQRDMSLEIEAQRKTRGGLTVRELGVDGVWRDVGSPLAEAGTYETYAGWDGRRELAVFIDNDTCATHGWDGRAWHALGELPTLPWKPNTLAQAPRGGDLLYLHNQRSTRDHEALLWELGDDGWSRREAGALEAYGGAAYDGDRDTTFVYGPWFGPGTVATTLARYDGERLVPAGQPVPAIAAASTGGPVLFWGTQGSPHGDFSRAAQRPYKSAAVSALVEGELQLLAPSPPALALVADAGGCFAVGFSGELFRLAGECWQRVAEGPAQFVERDTTNVGSDGDGRIFLVGGEPVRGAKRLGDTWLFDGERWAEVPAKGAAPAATEAKVAFDRSRGAWIVVGGTLKNYVASPKTYECDGEEWASFAADFGDGVQSLLGGALLLAFDSASATLFLVGYPDYAPEPWLYVYRGAGVWQRLATLESADGIAALAYDSMRRVLVTAGAGCLGEYEVAALLDSAAAAGGSAAREDRATEEPAATPTAGRAGRKVSRRRRSS
ncbi:hypothetical protein [Nannocystis punicea]|uniref:Uncharacterized protein n=1 Tax=Nannocystis punicea TaxID=2995304 RepID=A0ABY7GU36_9BACT|nr:hypothetical protein [Nannocystis poenicansa]WAS90448.1 hypothetical protein O0S08_30025 [Nannocystis poenicansa]